MAVRFVIMMVAVFATCGAAGGVLHDSSEQGGEPAALTERHVRKRVTLVMDGPCFERICRKLGMTETQRRAAIAPFLRYRRSVEALELEVETRTAPLHQQISEIPVENPLNRWTAEYVAALRPLNFQLRMEWSRSARLSREVFERFLEEVVAVLTEGKLERLAVAWRALRHDFYYQLPPRTAIHDFNDRVDLLLLYEAAAAIGGEFEPLHHDVETFGAVLTGIEAALEDYEAALGPLLESHYNEQLVNPSIDDELVLSREASERRAAAWGRRFDILRSGMERVGAAVESALPATAGQAWEARFWRALCPDLTEPWLPDDMVAWARALDAITQEQLVRIEIIAQQYLLRKQAMHRRAFEAGIRARRAHGTEWGGEHLQIAYARSIVNLRRLVEQTIASLKSELSAEQRLSWDEVEFGARYRGEDPFGPRIVSHPALVRLGLAPSLAGAALYLYDAKTNQTRRYEFSTHE